MIHKWWHVFIRRRTKPIPEDTAILWKRRLSLLYGFLAWNAFGLVVYSAYQGKADWAAYHGLKTEDEQAVPPGLSWANTLGIRNATVWRISGLKKVDQYAIVDGQKAENPDTNNQNEELKE